MLEFEGLRDCKETGQDTGAFSKQNNRFDVSKYDINGDRYSMIQYIQKRKSYGWFLALQVLQMDLVRDALPQFGLVGCDPSS